MRNAKKPGRKLGEFIAELPQKYHSKGLEGVVASFDSPHKEDAQYAYLIASVRTAQPNSQIENLLNQGIDWGLLTKSNRPIQGITFYKVDDGYILPINPRDRRALALIEAARRRNSELQALSNEEANATLKEKIKEKGK